MSLPVVSPSLLNSFAHSLTHSLAPNSSCLFVCWRGCKFIKLPILESRTMWSWVFLKYCREVLLTGPDSHHTLTPHTVFGNKWFSAHLSDLLSSSQNNVKILDTWTIFRYDLLFFGLSEIHTSTDATPWCLITLALLFGLGHSTPLTFGQKEEERESESVRRTHRHRQADRQTQRLATQTKQAHTKHGAAAF